jgi:glycosyltransferase involved in cell wall biosynthesis
MRKRLAIITTHPIQYNAPYFKMLSERGFIEVKVFYTWGESSIKSKFDPGFGKVVNWDVPLLEGYDYEFVENTAMDKGSHHFNGIINPALNVRVQEWAPTAVLIFGWNYRSHLLALRYFSTKTAILFRGDSTLLNEPFGFSWKKIVRRIFLRFVYRYVNYALYVGKQNYKYFSAHGLKPEQLTYCPHAIDNGRFMQPNEAYTSQAAELLNKLGVILGNIVFLFAGKFENNKNPIFLVETFLALNASNTHLIMVGNGELENELKSICRKVKNIHFLDFQNQMIMPAIYRMADVFILPSQSETWGLGANEAMACGCALLMSKKCGGADDLVIDGENGYVFESGNKHDLLQKMRLIIQGSRLAEMKQASRKHVEEFSFARICEGVENCVERWESSAK